jgi:hypothetical protein
MINAQQENARMLAAVLGIGEDEAAERLARTVLVTVGAGARDDWADEIIALLSLTVEVTRTPGGPVHAELVIGDAVPLTTAPRLHAAIDAAGVTIAADPAAPSASSPHPLFATIAACSVAAAALHLVIDDASLPTSPLPLSYRFDTLGVPPGALDRPVDLSGAVLVGAGAVGHGFLRALRHLAARGSLPIIDPKTVGEGNFNRCVYLRSGDGGRDKARALAMRAQGDFPNLALEPCVEEFRAYCKRMGPPATAIVTVDSRRARRSIQSELPGRVIDASTTDIRAVVVHSHRQPTEHACLACIYRHVPEENLRERAIAEGLGITVEMVKQGFISPAAAAAIAGRHQQVASSAIEGMAYDSLFKQLCAAQTLLSSDNRQVLAPFAFVSVLAGALQVVELLRSDSRVEGTNYWTVDPWRAPVQRARVLRPQIADCEFCANPDVGAIARELWG